MQRRDRDPQGLPSEPVVVFISGVEGQSSEAQGQLWTRLWGARAWRAFAGSVPLSPCL